MIVFLDTGVLGLIATPGNDGKTGECKKWYETLLSRSTTILTSEICAYETNRSLILASLQLGREVGGIQELANLRKAIEFLPVTQNVWQKAAQVWAQSMRQSAPMTDPKRLDADSIICAHWQVLEEENQGQAVIIASENLRDLNRFAIADLWNNIRL